MDSMLLLDDTAELTVVVLAMIMSLHYDKSLLGDGVEIHVGERSHCLQLIFLYTERAQIRQNINTTNLSYMSSYHSSSP